MTNKQSEKDTEQVCREGVANLVTTARNLRCNGNPFHALAIGAQIANMLDPELMTANMAAALLRIVELEDKLASLEQQEVTA